MKTAEVGPAAWKEVVARYHRSDRGQAIWQIFSSFIPFFGLLVLMYLSLGVGYWLTLLLAIPAGGFLIRIFIIQHDCGHGSFFDSVRSNDRLGFACGVVTMTPYGHWRLSHAIHHSGAANLARRGIGDIWTLTVNEYRASAPLKRLAYRLYRQPLVLFAVGPFLNMVVLQRFWFAPSLRKEWASMHWTNLAIGVTALCLILAVGLKAVVLVYAPIMAVAGSAGTWFFYVQHQFTHTYWAEDDVWDYSLAALKGTSYYKLPGVLRWFTGNIGFHHIHHLSPKVPNYKLKQCHEENPIFQQVEVLTLASSLRTASLRLWDEESQRLVSFRQARLA